MEPSQVIRSLSQVTVSEICRVLILLALVTVGCITAVLELLIGLDLVNDKSTLEALLGVSNSILQSVFTMEKMIMLHRIIVTISETLRSPAEQFDPEQQNSGPLPPRDPTNGRVQVSRSSSAILTMRMISSPAIPAPPSRFHSAVSVQSEDQ